MGDFQSLAQGAPLDLITELVAGGVGGNLAGVTLRSFSLGPVWNSLAGLIGGAAGAYALFGLGVMYADGGKASALSHEILAGAIGGASLIILLGLFRSMTAR